MPAVTRFVACKYKDSVTTEQKRGCGEGLLKMYAELTHLTNHGPIAGRDVSGMGRNKGMDFAFVVEFKSEQARDEFITHPLHDAFAKEVGDLFEDNFAYDIIQDDFGV